MEPAQPIGCGCGRDFPQTRLSWPRRYLDTSTSNSPMSRARYSGESALTEGWPGRQRLECEPFGSHARETRWLVERAHRARPLTPSPTNCDDRMARSAFNKTLRYTPAMAAGVSDRLWSVAELIEAGQ